MAKKVTLILAICCLVFILPAVLMAGGGFKEKIQNKLNAPVNVQSYQYENGSAGLEQGYSASSDELSIGESRTERNERGLRQDAKDKTRKLARTEPAPALGSYAIYRTNYKAEIEDNVVTVKGAVVFEVFKKTWTQLPLVSSSVGLIDVSVNKGASYVIMHGGKYYLMVDRPGRYSLDIEFLIKAARERENGPGNFKFEIMPAPISQFEFTMPETGVDIFVEPAIKVEVKREKNATVAWAVMPNTNNINVRWTKALPKEDIAPVKLEPKLYADTATYASVGEGLIHCRTVIKYSILQSEVSNLRLELPEDVSVLDVQGRDLRDWKVSSKGGQQLLDVYLTFGVKGSYILTLTYERNIGEGSVVADVPWIKTTGTERQTGYFGIAAATSVELAVNKTERVNPIDIRELPSSIWSRTANPILLAFKYLNLPFSIAIDVTKHEELPVLVAAVDSVNYVTLETDEGKSLTKAVYLVRNNVKQFIHLELPQDTTLWSAFVAGKPVKPAVDKSGSILIPLEKSQLAGESLTQFPVEVVYLSNLSKMGFIGGAKLNLPKTDIPISALTWSVYLPLDYLYFNFGGDVKALRESMQFLPSFAVNRTMQGRLKSDKVMSQVSSPREVFKEEFEGARMQGILPIKIDIPEEGRLYRFSKLLVTEEESPWMSVNFVKVSRKIQGFAKFLIFIAVLVLGIAFIKKTLKRKTKQDRVL